MSQANEATEVLAQVRRFLAGCRTASLATVDEDGAPHAANIQYANDHGLRLFWVSSRQTAHSRHLDHDDRVAVTVYGHDDRAPYIHGLQMHGTAELVIDEGDCRHAWQLFAAKFPFVADDEDYRRLVGRHSFYCMTPNWLRWIDNRVRFGYRVEVEL